MGLKDIHFKLKAFKLRRFRFGDGGSKKRENGVKKKPSWMMPISHGYHVIENKSVRGGSDEPDFDTVVVQREQFDEVELWFFGVFDPRIGDGVTKYIQSHFFDKKPKQSQINRKTKETMKKAYLGARAKAREAQKEDETFRTEAASAMLINGEKLVMANLGGYRAVVCRNGVAHQLSSKHHGGARRHWTRKLLFPVRILACDSSNVTATRHPKSSELVVGAEKLDAETEFIIIASTGIWEVMKNQEAVNLIRHLEDPQQAAECLTKEALTRMSKSNISCVIIRFD